MKKQTVFLAALLIYSLATIFTYQYERLLGDTILLLDIAEKYVRGDFRDAVNGMWGPLFSWLLVPFLYFGSSHVFAVNALHVIIGCLIIAGVRRLSFRFEMSDGIRNIILLCMVPILLYASLIAPHDFVLLCIIIYYLSIVFREDYPDRVHNGIMSGALGSLAYFAKPFGFPFFISHFVMINTLHYFKAGTTPLKRKVLRNLFAGMALFAVISSFWIILLSAKYNYLTFSTAGRHNFAILGPEAKGEGKEKGLPIFTEGFFEPPNKTASVVWEDATYLNVKSWSPLESWSYFKYFISRIIFKNLSQLIKILGSFSQLAVAIILMAVLLCVGPAGELLTRKSVLVFPLATMALYAGGYGVMHYEPRYLWIVNILLLLMGGHLMNILFRYEFFNNTRKNILILFFALSFLVVPVRYVIQRGDSGERIHNLASLLKNRYNIQGKIASNREYVSTNQAWYNSYWLTYFLKTRYYGQAKENISDNELEGELKKFGIDYYLVWGNHPDIPDFLSNYKEVTGGGIPGLKIYSLKEAGRDNR